MSGEPVLAQSVESPVIRGLHNELALYWEYDFSRGRSLALDCVTVIQT